MAPLTITQRIARARIYARDTAATSPGLSDSQWTSLINDASSLYRATFPDDFLESTTVTPTIGTYNFTAASSGSTGIRNVVAVSQGNLSGGLLPMEKVSMGRILTYLTASPSSQPIIGALAGRYAVSRATGQHTNVTIYIAPAAPGSVPYTVWFDPETVPMVSGTDTDGLDENASLTTAVMAAIWGCPLLGRPEMAQGLMAMLPQRIQEHMQTDLRAKAPGATNATEVA